MQVINEGCPEAAVIRQPHNALRPGLFRRALSILHVWGPWLTSITIEIGIVSFLCSFCDIDVPADLSIF